MPDLNVGVIGGDRRQAELVKLLQSDGHSVTTYGLEQWGEFNQDDLDRVSKQEMVIMPLPLCKPAGILNCETKKVPIEELFKRFKPEQMLLAGQIQRKEMETAESLGLHLVDYFKREELTVANAAATAEAAIQVAMDHSESTLLGKHCLVLGFGRIGKLLSDRLRGLGVRVTATARKPADLAWIQAYGWSALETDQLDGKLNAFDMVFNTIPAPILGETLLKQLKPDCLCVELASEQGIDLAAADQIGLPNVWARGLPGRFVPRSAAQYIRDAVYNIIKEN